MNSPKKVVKVFSDLMSPLVLLRQPLYAVWPCMFRHVHACSSVSMHVQACSCMFMLQLTSSPSVIWTVCSLDLQFDISNNVNIYNVNGTLRRRTKSISYSLNKSRNKCIFIILLNVSEFYFILLLWKDSNYT